MRGLAGRPVIETAHQLVVSALEQPNLYPQIRSDLMAIRNRLERAEGEEDRPVTLDETQVEILEAYIGIARQMRSLSPADEDRLAELARQLA